MPTTQTILPPPPFVIDQQIDPRSPIGQWMLEIQAAQPLRLVDTSGGSYSESAPPAGASGSPGLSNQNQEITYVKKSSDGNTFTLNGVKGGALTLTAQYSHLKIKSDGVSWWQTG